MKDQLSKIDQKIIQLKQKKEKLQTQQAILFLKEAQRVLGENFSPDLAISVLSHGWLSSSDSQKQEWEKAFSSSSENESHMEDENQSHSFRKPSLGRKKQSA